MAGLPRAGLRHERRRRTARVGLRLESLEARLAPAVYSPGQIRHAYGFDQIAFSSGGSTVPADGRGQTIAVVDAYDDPRAWTDLQTFDRQWGLADPPSFKKVSQT